MTYIRVPGDPQGRPPFLGRGILMHGGFIDGTHDDLQNVVDVTLNQIDPDLHFEAVGDRVLYAALYAEKMSSEHEDDRRFGSVPEKDIGLWILTWGGRKGHPPALRWTAAFIFVDSPSALMTGRELYGYPKQFGRIVRLGSADGDFGVALRAVAFQREDAEEIGREHEVLRVERTAGTTALTQPDEVATLAGFRARIDRKGDWRDAVDQLMPPLFGMPMVFLRQMRDVASADATILQEVVTVTVVPHDIGLPGLADNHHIRFATLASFRIPDILGCPPSAQLDWPFWLRFNFRVGVGERL